MPEENEQAEEKEKSLSLSEKLGISHHLSQISRWKRYVPYPSNIGWSEGEYIPQPKIQITANSEWLRPKLHALSQFARELRWVVRILSAILIIYVVMEEPQDLKFDPSLLRIIGLFSAFLLIISIFSFRVVAIPESIRGGGNLSVSASTKSADEDTEESQ